MIPERGFGMERVLKVQQDAVRQLVEDWVIGYETESQSEDGDPEAFIERICELADAAGPESAAHRALAEFLERMGMLEA